MKIGGISQTGFNKLSQQKKYNSNSITNNQVCDTVSFQGRKPVRRSIMALLLSAVTMFSACSKAPANNAQGTTPTTTATEPAPVFYNANKLRADYEYQVAQTTDAPSLTFDLTDNYKPVQIKPVATTILFTQNPKAIDEYNDINLVVDELYKVPENAEPARNLIAYGMMRTPWMPEQIMPGVVNYAQGDVTNIPTELIYGANYTANLQGSQRAYLSTITMLDVEEDNNASQKEDATQLVYSSVFTPRNADIDGFSIIELTEADFKGANNNFARAEVIGKRIAKEYNIPTINSYAGDAIVSAIALWEENEAIFVGANEENALGAMAEFVANNGSIRLVLPKSPVTIIANEGQSVPKTFLTAEKELDTVISYIAFDDIIFVAKKDSTLRDILAGARFPDGTSLLEAYQLDPEKHEGLIMATIRQVADNDNALSARLEGAKLTPEILNLRLEEGTKVNLQPVRVAHFIGDAEPEEYKPPVGGPKPDPEPDQTETTEATEPSETTEPTEPSETTEPTDPTETTCPDLPEIPTRPTQPKPTAPTLPSPTETKPEETKDPYCPTEPSQPDSDFGDGATQPNYGGGFEETRPAATQPAATQPAATQPAATQPPATQPPATQPPATQPPATQPAPGGACPTEGKQDDSDYGDGAVQPDFSMDFE